MFILSEFFQSKMYIRLFLIITAVVSVNSIVAVPVTNPQQSNTENKLAKRRIFEVDALELVAIFGSLYVAFRLGQRDQMRRNLDCNPDLFETNNVQACDSDLKERDVVSEDGRDVVEVGNIQQSWEYYPMRRKLLISGKAMIIVNEEQQEQAIIERSVFRQVYQECRSALERWRDSLYRFEVQAVIYGFDKVLSPKELVFIHPISHYPSVLRISRSNT